MSLLSKLFGTMSSEGEVSLESEPSSGTFVFDLNVSSILVSETRCLLRAPLTPEVAASDGSACLGMLVSLMDVAAAEPAMVSCRPDWTATQDLSIHGAQSRLVEGPVVLDVRLVRSGKKAIVIAANIYDGHGVDDFHALQRGIDDDTEARPTLTHKGLVTFVRLPRTAASGYDDYDPWRWLGQVRHRPFRRPRVGMLQERIGARILDAASGALELPRTRYVSNALGTIFGGAQAMLLQLAAEAMQPGLIATDLQLHYLSQVRAGPVRTRGRVSRVAPDHSVVTLELTDAGHDDLLIALATVTLQLPAR